MTDKEFKKVIDDAAKAYKTYQEKIKIAETEYKYRYGHYPKDIYNKVWLDNLYVTGTSLTLAEVEETVKDFSYSDKTDEEEIEELNIFVEQLKKERNKK